MANSDIPSSEARSEATAKAPGDQSIRQPAGTQGDHPNFSAYSLSSPELRNDIRKLAAGDQSRAGIQLAAAEGQSSFSPAPAPEVPALLQAPMTTEVSSTPQVPELLRAPTIPGSLLFVPGQAQPVGAEQPPPVPAVPIAPAEQMEDKNKTIDPCTKQVVNSIPAPGDMPKAMDSVKDRDPALYKQIQAKVTDPRYTGEMGNITVSTHDKKGQVNGCVFVQNVPYWESGPAAQALVDVNKILATKGKKLEADPLNGAGRSLPQEEAIVWRNSGLHAKVGRSNHGFGKAEDFKPDSSPDAKRQPWEDPFVNATLHAHGWRQGDSWGPLKNDLHHWSFVGPGPATDGHPPPRKTTHTTHPHHKHR